MAEEKQVSFMHMIQAFLMAVPKALIDQLPEEAGIIGRGRTIVSGEWAGKPWRVRVSVGKFEDDMWPHIEATIQAAGVEKVLDIHPDSNVDGHTQEILAEMKAMLSV